jgi:hypothetical protein
METTMSVALALVGIGAVVAGAVGLLLPQGERFAAAALALVIGAGAGVIALAIGWNGLAVDDQEGYERAFLIASAVGLVAVLVSLAVSWRRRTRV